MRRVNIFLADKLLDLIDDQANKEGITRTALIYAVLEKYIEARRSERDHRAKRSKIHKPRAKWMRWQKSWGMESLCDN
jgi:metal-responsive CopG/Arc/MetJ family transcriptional regulator